MKNIRFAALIAFIFLFASGLSAHEFLNTFMQINIGYSYGLSINGDMLDAENRNKSVDRKLKYVNDSFNFMTDLVPFKPIFLGDESHALKIGVRGGYRMHFVEQKTTISGEDYGGDLMGYSTFVFGPLIRYAPSISFFSDNGEYSATSGFTMYMLYGHIMNGHLDAFPVRRAYDPAFSAPSHSVVRGYKLDFGIGAETTICAINLGVNIYYSQLHIQLRDRIYTETGRNSIIHESNIEVYIGMPLENIISVL